MQNMSRTLGRIYDLVSSLLLRLPKGDNPGQTRMGPHCYRNALSPKFSP